MEACVSEATPDQVVVWAMAEEPRLDSTAGEESSDRKGYIR